MSIMLSVSSGKQMFSDKQRIIIRDLPCDICFGDNMEHSPLTARQPEDALLLQVSRFLLRGLERKTDEPL